MVDNLLFAFIANIFVVAILVVCAIDDMRHRVVWFKKKPKRV